MKLKIKSLNELEQRSKDQQWLIEGLWATEGQGMISAEPKCGKTWLALDMAVSVATGTKCLGEYNVKNPHKVLFFNGEDTEEIQRSRLESITKAKGVTDLSNLGIITAKEGLRLDLKEGIEALRTLVAEFRPALLILDPFVRMHRISESDSKAVAAILGELRKIKDDFNTAVVLVHHAKKGGKGARAGQRIRGSGEFHAWGESLLFLSKDASGATVMDVEHRASESVNGVEVQISQVNTGTCLLTKNCKDFEETPKVSENYADSILKSIESSIAPTTIESIIARTGYSKSQVQNELYKLLKNKQVEWSPKGYLRGEL